MHNLYFVNINTMLTLHKINIQMARKKLNEGKVKKLIDLSPDAVRAIEDKANESGLTFKYYAQNILEQAAKKLK